MSVSDLFQPNMAGRLTNLLRIKPPVLKCRKDFEAQSPKINWITNVQSPCCAMRHLQFEPLLSCTAALEIIHENQSHATLHSQGFAVRVSSLYHQCCPNEVIYSLLNHLSALLAYSWPNESIQKSTLSFIKSISHINHHSRPISSSTWSYMTIKQLAPTFDLS